MRKTPQSGGGQEPEPINRITIFNPQAIVCRGMISYLFDAALLPGYMQQITNMRASTRALQTRAGISLKNQPLGLGYCTFQGGFAGIMNGQPLLVCGIDVSAAGLSSTYIYSVSTSTWSYTELTGSGAQYGNTRMTAGNPVSFAIIRDPNTSADLLEIQNGLDFPRIWDGTKTAIHQPINVPTNPGLSVTYLFAQNTNIVGWSVTSSHQVAITNYAEVDAFHTNVTTNGPVPFFVNGPVGDEGYLVIVDPEGGGNPPFNPSQLFTVTNIVSADELTFAGFGTTFVAQGTPFMTAIGVTNQYPTNAPGTAAPQLLVSPSIITGDNTYVALETPLILTNADSLVFAFAPQNYITQGQWISGLQIGISTSSTSCTVIYDPTVPSYVQPVILPGIDPNNSQSYIMSIPLTAVLANDPNLSVSYIRFQWVAAPPTAPGVLSIGGVYNSGGNGVVGGAQYTISYYNSASRSESAGYIPIVSQTNPGGNLTGLQFATASIPYSASLTFNSVISAINVSASEIKNGTDSLQIYREDANGVQFNYIATVGINTFSGGQWQVGIANSIIHYVDNVAITSENVARIAPDAYSICTPVAKQILAANGRIFCGGVGQTSQNYVYISEFYNHCRYRPFVRYLSPGVPDESSATVVQFPGETFSSMILGGASFIGVAPVIIFTNANTWNLTSVNIQSLSRPSCIGYMGGPYRNGCTQFLGQVYMVDSESQIRVVGSGGLSNPISKLRIDNKLASANLTNVSLAVVNDELLVAYQPLGMTSNTNVLVYATTPGLQYWVEDIPNTANPTYSGSGNVQQFIMTNFNGSKQCLFFDYGGNIYRYLDPTESTDIGQPINIEVISGSFHNEMWNRIYSERVGIVCDPIAATWQVVRYWRNKVSGQDGTINIGSDTSHDTAWIYEAIPGQAGIKPGGIGLSFAVGVAGTSYSGQRIEALIVEAKGMDESGAVSSES